ncbi:hypothetical protein BLOT_000182 [Blomia tropicalis]|nr:hypothetical protein BLOT_000182 [Blomia tropicalis]
MKSEEPKIIGIERKKNEKFSQQIIMYAWLTPSRIQHKSELTCTHGRHRQGNLDACTDTGMDPANDEHAMTPFAKQPNSLIHLLELVKKLIPDAMDLIISRNNNTNDNGANTNSNYSCTSVGIVETSIIAQWCEHDAVRQCFTSRPPFHVNGRKR